MAPSDVTANLLREVERIQPLLTDNAKSAEANRQLSSTAYDAMYEVGLFAMLAPRAHGGLELHPVEAMRVWEVVTRIDSAAAWNLVMNQAIAAYAAWLPAEGAREIFSDGPATVAGALHPPPAGETCRRWLASDRPCAVRERMPQRQMARDAGGRDGR